MKTQPLLFGIILAIFLIPYASAFVPASPDQILPGNLRNFYKFQNGILGTDSGTSQMNMIHGTGVTHQTMNISGRLMDTAWFAGNDANNYMINYSDTPSWIYGLNEATMCMWTYYNDTYTLNQTACSYTASATFDNTFATYFTHILDNTSCPGQNATGLQAFITTNAFPPPGNIGVASNNVYPIPQNSWHHECTVITPITGGSNIKYYYDGNLQSPTPLENVTGIIASLSPLLNYSLSLSTADTPRVGGMAEFAVYDKALNVGQVRALAGIPCSELDGYYTDNSGIVPFTYPYYNLTSVVTLDGSCTYHINASIIMTNNANLIGNNATIIFRGNGTGTASTETDIITLHGNNTKVDNVNFILNDTSTTSHIIYNGIEVAVNRRWNSNAINFQITNPQTMLNNITITNNHFSSLSKNSNFKAITISPSARAESTTANISNINISNNHADNINSFLAGARYTRHMTIDGNTYKITDATYIIATTSVVASITAGIGDQKNSNVTFSHNTIEINKTAFPALLITLFGLPGLDVKVDHNNYTLIDSPNNFDRITYSEQTYSANVQWTNNIFNDTSKNGFQFQGAGNFVMNLTGLLMENNTFDTGQAFYMNLSVRNALIRHNTFIKVNSTFPYILTFNRKNQTRESPVTDVLVMHNTFNQANILLDSDVNSTGIFNFTCNTYTNTTDTDTEPCAVPACTPNWQCNGYGSCNTTDTEDCNSVMDLNTCAIPYTGNFTEFTTNCNYCTSTYSTQTGNCIAGLQNVGYTYTNNCCAQTSLPSDCNIPTNTSNATCVFGYTPTYVTGDLSAGIINGIVVFFITIGSLAVVIVIILIIGWATRKKK